MTKSSRWLVLIVGVPLLTLAAMARAHDPIGCYLATPPFRPTDNAAASDSNRAVLEIEPEGVLRAQSPALRVRMRGAWSARGDSLFAWYSDGFTGWRYRLGSTSTGWQGIGEFLSDEIVPGDTRGPFRQPAQWIRRACAERG